MPDYDYFDKAGQSSLHGMFLDEQFRMFTPALMDYINQTFYHGQMIDATRGFPNTPNVKFFRELFKKFRIENNLVVVLVKNSTSQAESGGKSIYNLGTQYFITELMKEARKITRTRRGRRGCCIPLRVLSVGLSE